MQISNLTLNVHKVRFFQCTQSGPKVKGPSIKYVRKIFQKSNISNPLIHIRVHIRGLEILVFQKSLRTYLMDDP